MVELEVVYKLIWIYHYHTTSMVKKQLSSQTFPRHLLSRRPAADRSTSSAGRKDHWDLLAGYQPLQGWSHLHERPCEGLWSGRRRGPWPSDVGWILVVESQSSKRLRWQDTHFTGTKKYRDIGHWTHRLTSRKCVFWWKKNKTHATDDCKMYLKRTKRPIYSFDHQPLLNQQFSHSTNQQF